jgi:hypothetical protein
MARIPLMKAHKLNRDSTSAVDTTASDPSMMKAHIQNTRAVVVAFHRKRIARTFPLSDCSFDDFLDTTPIDPLQQAHKLTIDSDSSVVALVVVVAVDE